MGKANNIQTPCFRASQLRSFCLIAFLLCQSLRSIVSLPAILSDVELASKIRAEPIIELSSQSRQTSENAVKTFSRDKVKVPKTKWVTLDDYYKGSKKNVKYQSLPTDADSVTSNKILSTSGSPGAPSLLIRTQRHKEIVQQRLNKMVAEGNLASGGKIDDMFYEAEAQIKQIPLEEVYKTFNVKPYTPPQWNKGIRAKPSKAPTISTYTPSHWNHEIQAANLNHRGNHPLWKTMEIDNHNEFASQGHHPNLHIRPSPYSAQHVGTDGVKPYIPQHLAHAQYAHPNSYDPAPSDKVAQKYGTGYFHPQPPKSHNVPHNGKYTDWKEDLDDSQDWEDLHDEIEKYRHHQGFMVDDLPHIDDIVKYDGFKEPASYDDYFTSAHKAEVPKPYKHTATSRKNPHMTEERESRFPDIGKDPMFHPKINNHQRSGTIGTFDHGDKVARPSSPRSLHYPNFDFFSPSRFHHTWPTDEAPITTNTMEKMKPTYASVVAS